MLLNPSERNPIKVADWLEVQVLQSQSREYSLEKARLHIDIDGSLAEEVDKGDETLLLSYEISEQLLALAEEEIERRCNIGQGAYPFKLSNEILIGRIAPRYMPYIFCLLASDREYYHPGNRKPEILFEHLVCEAIAEHIGGRARRFGEPRDTMPRGIIDAIEMLSKLTGCKKLHNGYPTNDNDKDLGLDVAAWKNFSDSYFNKILFYFQCATGDNWETKKNDCNLEEWRGILYWAFYPVKGLAVPYILSEDEWERETCGLLVMDRLRISTCLKRKDLVGKRYKWWDWCKQRIQEMRQRN